MSGKRDDSGDNEMMLDKRTEEGGEYPTKNHAFPAPGIKGPAITAFSGSGAEPIDITNLEENSMDLCCMASQNPLLPTLSNLGLAPGLHWEKHLSVEEQEKHKNRMCEEMHDKNVCYWHHG
jgi:hypothetical protein